MAYAKYISIACGDYELTNLRGKLYCFAVISTSSVIFPLEVIFLPSAKVLVDLLNANLLLIALFLKQHMNYQTTSLQ